MAEKTKGEQRIWLAAIILTRDEERDLPGCLESLNGVADEVYVVDSGSGDGTVGIAKRMGAVVLRHPFENYARQFNWAIDNIGTSAEWVMRIDADERVDEEQWRSLRALMESAGEDVTGIDLARRTVFLEKRLRFGGTFPVWVLRVWRRGRGRCEDRWMDEHMVVVPPSPGYGGQGGRVVKARGELIHVIPKSLAEWSRKHVWYAERECLDAMREAGDGRVAGQAGLKRAAKTKVYYRMPALVREIGRAHV